MEVKKLFLQHAQQKKFTAHEIAKEYFENPKNVSENIPSSFLKESSNLLDINEHSEQGIFNCLNKRMNFGIPYTMIGKDLLAINCDYPGDWYFSTEARNKSKQDRPHPYLVGSNAYTSLKDTQENQVITMLGASGSGKTFNTVHILDYLIEISSQDLVAEGQSNLFDCIHKGIQLLHIMGSVKKKQNLESTVCALDISVNFDSKFRCSGATINSELLDLTLPYNKKGRTFQILHSIMHCDPGTLKILGLCNDIPYRIFEGQYNSSELQIFDIEVNQRFFECLNYMGASVAEKKGFLEILSSVINLFDMDFVYKLGELEPRNRSLLKKLAKLLGIQENAFINNFRQFKSKKECEDRCKDLARFLYLQAFKWLNKKINHKLAQISKDLVQYRKNKIISNSDSMTDEAKNIFLNECTSKYCITILDFPGFTKEKSLGGLGINLAFESLNYYSSTNYIKLTNQLSSQKITMNNIKPCKSKAIVELFMNSQLNFMHSLSASEKEFNKFIDSLGTLDKNQDIIIFLTQKDFQVNFTFGSVIYNFEYLRQQSLRMFYNDFNMAFAKSCTSPILAKIPNSSQKTVRFVPNFEECFTSALRKTLMPYLELSPFVIYCLKADNRVLERRGIEFVRNSLIEPTLVWKWYGYPHWMRTSSVALELGIKGYMESYGLKRELEKRFGWEDVVVTDNYILLKEKQMRTFKEYINKKQNSKSSMSDLGMSLSLFSMNPEKDFQLIIHEEAKNVDESTPEEIHLDNPFKTMDLDMYLNELEETRTTSASSQPSVISSKSLKSKSQHSSSTSPSDSIIVFHPPTKKQRSFQIFIDYNRVNYSQYISHIICIQKFWRGYCTRQYTQAYKTLYNSAKLIQKRWRGYITRKHIKPVLRFQKSAYIIQKHWKLHVLRKKIAARKIFRWYQNVKKTLAAKENDIKVQVKPNKHSSKNSKYRKISSKSSGKYHSKTVSGFTDKSERSNGKSINDYSKRMHNKTVSGITDKSMKSYGKKSGLSYVEDEDGAENKNTQKSPIKDDSDSYFSSSFNENEYFNHTFSPNISPNSRALARKKMLKFDNLSYIERFRILEAQRLESLVQKRQDKVKKETFPHSPTINNVSSIHGTFEARQVAYIKSFKEKLNLALNSKPIEDYPFKPEINKGFTDRPIERTIEDLYKWAKHKDKKIITAQEEKEEKELKKLSTFKVTGNSVAHSENRRNKLKEQNGINEILKRDSSPYWPNEG